MLKSWRVDSYFSVLMASLVCVTGFWWIPAFESATGLRIFAWPGSVFLLGLSGFSFIFGAKCLPDRLINGFSSKPMRSISPVLIATIVALLLVFALYAINQYVLNAFLSSADEHSCYFLAECLLRGRLWVEPHELSEFFNVTHVGNRAGKWFSVYPLGWPLIWAAGIKLNIVDWLNPIMATLSVAFFFAAGRILFGAFAAAVGLLLVVISPFFLFTSASYFSHTTCLLMISIFFYSYLKWMRVDNEKQRIFWSGIAAFAVGYGLMTRYLTMAAIAAPFLIHYYWPLLWRKRSWKASDWIAPAIIAVFFLLILWQNYEITGKPFKAPNKFDKSWERLGFRADYTPLTGLNYLVARFFYLADWMPGAWIVVFFTAFFTPYFKTPHQKMTRLAFLVPAGAYFFYYSWGGNQWGPRYYYEGILFLGLTVGAALCASWKAGDVRLRKGIISVLIFSIASNFYLFYEHAEFHSEASSQRKALYVLAEKETQKPALVFIHGFLGHRLVMDQLDAVRNHPELKNDILYAHDRGDENQRLMAMYPNRQYYRGSYDRETLEAKLERLS